MFFHKTRRPELRAYELQYAVFLNYETLGQINSAVLVLVCWVNFLVILTVEEKTKHSDLQ